MQDEPSQSPTRDSSPEGRALGKEGRFRPHRSTARRSLPISGKLYAPAKASPFRERWHGDSRDGEGCLRDEPLPSFRFAKCHLPRRWRPWQRGQVSSSFVNGKKKPADKRKTLRPCQSLSLSGEVARRSRDGEGGLQNPHTQKTPPGGSGGSFLQQTPLISDIYARHGPRCRPGCRRPGTRPRPGRPPAAPQT